MTALECINWSKRRARNCKLGTNYYLEIVQVIRTLVGERAALNKRNAELEAQIVKLTTPPLKRTRAFGTEGQGDWDVVPPFNTLYPPK